MKPIETIIDIIARLQDAPEQKLYVYDRRGRRIHEQPYPELARRARATAAKFDSAPGQIVFLQLPNSQTLVECLLGAIIAGLVPCCLAPPRALGGIETFQGRMQLLMRAFPNSQLVTREDVGSAAGVPYALPPDVSLDDPLAPLPDIDPEALAFVQLTSGSTRQPKAVRISHRALVSNVQAFCECAHRSSDEPEAIVSWLPLYHDMGLVGNLFSGLFLRNQLHLMTPDAFLARPLSWLRIISDAGEPVVATAPNFAYQECVRRITPEQVETLDLSRWNLAGCGAERVRSETLDAFATHFEPAGFSRKAFVPCYGMAESTLAVTFGAGDRIPPRDDGHVSCGRPIPGTQLVIRDPEGNPLPDGDQGEITVTGPSLCSGYAGSDQASPIRDGWLYTGDRGYVRDGELYVTGRYDDLIIVEGVNIDPDEFEAIADDVVQIVGGRSAAFPIEEAGREKVVLVSEATPQPSECFEAWGQEIGGRVGQVFGFKLHDMVFVRRGAMSKTSSGKVKRAKLRESYQKDELDVLWSQRT
jgi:acyl-CoA synthetase (AMP-forming)/AMP-acid ligase II